MSSTFGGDSSNGNFSAPLGTVNHSPQLEAQVLGHQALFLLPLGCLWSPSVSNIRILNLYRPFPSSSQGAPSISYVLPPPPVMQEEVRGRGSKCRFARSWWRGWGQGAGTTGQLVDGSWPLWPFAFPSDWVLHFSLFTMTNLRSLWYCI